MIVNWPGVVSASQVNNNYVMNTDYFPTFLEILEVKNTNTRLDGKSMLPTWKNPNTSFNRGPIYWHYPHFSNQLGRPSGAIRDGDFKLIEIYETGKIELYNLATDVGEQNDLSASDAKTTKRLLATLRKWQKEVDANMPLPNPGYGK